MRHTSPYRFGILPLSAAISVLMLTACSSGGSFNNPAVIQVGHIPAQLQPSPQTTDNTASETNQPDNTNTQQDNQTNPLTVATLGSAMPIVKRNLAIDDGRPVEPHAPLGIERLQTLGANDFGKLRQEISEKQPNQTIHQSDDGRYQFVKAGWIFAGLYPANYHTQTDSTGKIISEIPDGTGYLYYHGSTPATGKTQGQVKYTGHWDFISDAKHARDIDSEGSTLGEGSHYGMDNRFADEIGAASFAEQVFGQVAPRQGNHLAEFDADFDQKTLTGKFSSKQQKTKTQTPTLVERYQINAKIHGNRFTGDAIATNKAKQLNLFNSDAIARLEGGFFGDNAEELAGKFFSDDETIFGVFAGKQDNPATLERKYDGVYVELTQDAAVNPAQVANVLPLANFGNVDQLLIGNQLIELLPQQDGQITQQSVTLANGQTAVITSFGSADGTLRLGSISKTAAISTRNLDGTNEPDASAEEQAKLALTAKIDDLRQTIQDNVDLYLQSEEEDEKDALRSQIVDDILSGYGDADEQADIRTQIDELFARLDEDAEDLDAVDEIIALFEQGDKYDLENAENWQAFLPNADDTAAETANPPTNTQSEQDRQQAENIAKAKAMLDEYIAGEQQEIRELLQEYRQEKDEDAQNQLAELIGDKVLDGYTQDKHAEIETALGDLLAEIESEQSIEKILQLFAKGDRLDGNNPDNLAIYLALLNTDNTNTDHTNNAQNTGNAPTRPNNHPAIGIEESLTGLYLLGERTSISQIPNAGEAKYLGTWHGRIGNHWQSKAGYGEYDGKASFAVNFGDKTLTGELTESRGVEAAFLINAKIHGNGFSGTATSRTGGINLDAGQQQNQQILPAISTDNLTGAFYGENAKHLGGSFSFQSNLQDSTNSVVGGAVFYGTKTDEDKE